MAQVFVTPRAKRDVEELGGNWAPVRFVLGPWPWMILLYRYEESSDRIYAVAMHDGRSATSAIAAQRWLSMKAPYGCRGVVQMPSG